MPNNPEYSYLKKFVLAFFTKTLDDHCYVGCITTMNNFP